MPAAAVSPDPDRAGKMASWWVRFYLTEMGPLYAARLWQLGFGAAVDQVVSMPGPTPEILLDELTPWGDAAAGREAVQRFSAAGADMPVITLPPYRSLEELDYILDSFGHQS